MKMITIRLQSLFNTTRDRVTSVGLLLLRLGVSAFMGFLHGWPKLANFLQGTADFPDPVGLGSEISLILATFAEVACSLLLVLGVFTRISVLPLIITMIVVVFIVNAGEAMIVRERASMFLLIYIFFFLAGPGRYSIDALLYRQKMNENLQQPT